MTETYGEKTVELVRVLDAPREKVWRAWTDPARMAAWWGPKGFTNPECDMDVRVGGRIRIVMQAENGSRHPMSGEFLEVVPPERLVFAAWPEFEDGTRYADTRSEVTFEALDDGRTRLTVRATAVGLKPDMLDGMEEGYGQSLVRLAALVETPA